MNNKIPFPDILSILESQAAKIPHRVAIVGHNHVSLNFGDLYNQVQVLASQILSRSKIKGHAHTLRTAIVLPNGPEMSKTLLASSVSGAAVPLNPSYTEYEFSEYFNQAKVTSIITIPGFSIACERAARQNNLPIFSFEELSNMDMKFVLIAEEC